MNPITKVTATDVLAMINSLKASKDMGADSAFRNLLNDAMIGTGSTQQAPKSEKPADMGKDAPKGKEPQTPPADDVQPTDQAVADAVAAAMNPEQMPVSEAPQEAQSQEVQAQGTVVPPVIPGATAATVEVHVGGTQLDQAVPVAETMAAQTQEQKQQGGDVLSMELTTETTEESPALPVQQTARPAPEAPAQERFDAMIGKAQQQLVEMNQAPIVEKESSAPTGKTAEMPVEVKDGQDDTETQVKQGQEKLQEETKAASKAADTTAPRVQTQPEAKPVDQKPQREMSKEDRSLLEMQTAAETAQQKPAQAVRPERAPEPQPMQQPQSHAAPAEPSEQIRVQVAENLGKSNMEFRMQLAPEELGKIDVKMTVAGGRLAVEIIAAGERTAELLGRQVNSLLGTLRMHTAMEVSSVQVVQETSTASGNMQGLYYNGAQTQSGGQSQSQSGSGTSANPQGDDLDLPEAEQGEEEPASLLNRRV